MKDDSFFRKLADISLINTHFAFLDTGEYLADPLFLRHRVRVHFGDELGRDGSPYRIIFCYVRKWDVPRFRAAMRELPKKMMLCGYPDYLEACQDLWDYLAYGEEGRPQDPEQIQEQERE